MRPMTNGAAINAIAMRISTSKPSKKPCGACARRRAKLVKLLKSFKGKRK